MPPAVYDNYVMQEDRFHSSRFSVSLIGDYHCIVHEGAADPCAGAWALEEDRMLVQCEQAQLTESDFVDEYAKQKIDQPRIFRKNPTGEQLKARLGELRTESNKELYSRYRLLLKSELQTDKQEKEKAFTRRRKEPSSFDTEITCEDGTVIMGKSECLKSASFRVAALLKDAQPNKNELARIEINQALTSLPDCDSFSAFCGPTVQHFVNSTSSPDWDKELSDLRETLETLQEKEQGLWGAVCRKDAGIRETAIESIHEMRARELAELDSTAKAALEQDIQALRGVYSAHVARQQTKITLRYKNLEEQTNSFFDDQASQVSTLYTSYDETVKLIESTKAQLQAVSATVSNMYKPSTVPRLLILAEVLQAPTLRESLMQEIVAAPLTFLRLDETAVMSPRADSRAPPPPPAAAMCCQLIRSATLLEILSKVDLSALVSLAGSEDCALSLEYFTKELDMRRGAFEETLRGDSVAELSERLKSTDHACFHTSVLNELQKRQRAESAGGVSARMLSESSAVLQVLPNGVTLELQQPARYATALASHGRAEGEGWGLCYYEVQIRTLNRLSGAEFSAGYEAITASACTSTTKEIVPPAASKFFKSPTSHLPGLCPSASGMYGCVYASNGMLHSHGTSEEAGPVLWEGDTLGVLLDQTQGEVTFSKNGEVVSRAAGVALVDGGVSGSGAQQKYHVAPCVTLFSSSLHEKVKVHMVFTEPFAYPPAERYAPYSR